jgi:cyclic pyranopterin phosphate synthase
MALDRFGRDIHYLRISLTDRCNLRCVYCMPEDMTFWPKAELMQDAELLRLMPLFTELGFHKYRLTGGEPTVRQNIVEVVRGIAHTPGVHSVSMTTNGMLLKQLAAPLKAAGLQRVNVSIDTLDPEKFRRITRWGSLGEVWGGLEEAERVGLTPIKINAVIVRNYNDTDAVDLAQLTLEHNWQIRFIEMMPFGEVADFQTAAAVTAEEIRARVAARFGPVEVLHDGKLDGEAKLYKIRGARGELGFINTLTEPFCAACTRARLTADGKLRMCLLREYEVDLLTPLRAGATNEDLKQLINHGVGNKPWGHGLSDNVIPLNRVMSEIGG